MELSVACSRIVAVEQATQAAEERAFFPAFAANTRGRHDAIRHAAQRQRLQPDLAGATERREEQAFAAEQRGFDAADELDVEVHRRLVGDDAAGVHAEQFPGCQLAFMDVAAGVEESPTITLQPLHDEAFAAEETGADLFVERNTDTHAFRSAEERIFLSDEFTPDFREMDRNDLARKGRSERDALFAHAAIVEDGHEQRFAGEQAFAGTEQAAEETGVLLRAVPEDGLHLDAVVHVHHATRFRDGGLIGVEFEFDVLHGVAEHLVINFVHLIHSFTFAELFARMMPGSVHFGSYKLTAGV